VSDFASEFDPIDEVAQSFVDRYRRGERPSLTEYIERFPHLADRIRELFPALVRLTPPPASITPTLSPCSVSVSTTACTITRCNSSRAWAWIVF